MDAFNNINTDDFISEIESEPCLWNTSLDDYSNKILKKNAWERIILKFVDDFNDKSSTEKNKIACSLQRKWKSLRDSFTRELLKKKKEKSGSAAVTRKQYVYFNQLSFLQTVTKATTSSIEDDDMTQELDETLQDSQATEEINTPRVSQPTRKRRYSRLNKSSTEQEEEELLKVLKERIIKDTSLPPKESDADTLFMMSLVPELKEVPANMKLEVKCELMKVLQRARLHYYPTSNTFSNNINHPSDHHFIQSSSRNDYLLQHPLTYYASTQVQRSPNIPSKSQNLQQHSPIPSTSQNLQQHSPIPSTSQGLTQHNIYVPSPADSNCSAGSEMSYINFSN